MSDSKEHTNKFEQHVTLISAKISELLTEIFMEDEKPPIEAAVYSLLKTGAFIAIYADCPEESFSRLAQIAFKDETQVKKQEEHNKTLN